MHYGFAADGEPMRFASRRKTILDAVLAIRKGKHIVRWHAPGMTQTTRDANIVRLRAEIEAELQRHVDGRT